MSMLKKYFLNFPFYFTAITAFGMTAISYITLAWSGFSWFWWPTGISAVIGCFSLLLRTFFVGIGEGEVNHPVIAKHYTPSHDKNQQE
jgi:hypothetical protein